MKKRITVLIVALILTLGIKVHAQTTLDDPAPRAPRSSYSLGFRFSYEEAPIKLGNGMEDSFQAITPGLFYRRESRNFVFGISPNISFQDSDFTSSDTVLFRADVQLLYRYPLIDRFVSLALFVGPELTLSQNIGVHLLAGLDSGIRITRHHALYLDFAAGIGYPAGLNKMLDKYPSAADAKTDGLPIKFQWSIGVRTLVF